MFSNSSVVLVTVKEINIAKPTDIVSVVCNVVLFFLFATQYLLYAILHSLLAIHTYVTHPVHRSVLRAQPGRLTSWTLATARWRYNAERELFWSQAQHRSVDQTLVSLGPE